MMCYKHKYCRDVAFYRTAWFPLLEGELWTGWWVTLNGTVMVDDEIKVTNAQMGNWGPYEVV